MALGRGASLGVGSAYYMAHAQLPRASAADALRTGRGSASGAGPVAGFEDDRHLYMMWLWMERIFEEDAHPFAHRHEVTDATMPGLLRRKGAEALKRTMTIMKLEVPLLSLAAQFTASVRDMSCIEIYQEELGMKIYQAKALCDESEHFTFRISLRIA